MALCEMGSNMESQTSSGGISVLGLLGVAFVILKLCGVIHWSWWWVTCPFWGPLASVAAIAAVAFIGMVVVEILRSIK